MATLDDFAEMTRNAFEWLGNASLAPSIILSLPLAVLVLTRVLGQYASVGEGDAVFLISVVGGLFGFAAQSFGKEQIKAAEKPIAGEAVLVPAVGGVVVGIFVMLTLLPPSPFAVEVERVTSRFVGG